MAVTPILLVEDDDDLREALSDTLSLGGYQVVEAEDGQSALQLLQKTSVSLVLSDVQMRPMDGETLLREVKQRYPHLPVILMTAFGEIERAVAAMHAGAAHYLPKPFEPDDLLAAIARYKLSGDMGERKAIIAADPGMQKLLLMSERVAQSEATVLITGESGTGKEVLARFLHDHSARAAKPFVAINCAAIPEQLLESTLFGHEKGAFTGAAAQHTGKFEQAQGGTLLLDEITEMPMPLQAKLLRVLQEREMERVGGSKTIPLDIRVLATSNRNLKEAVQAGQFREDLYYRLNVFPLHLPPLRERRQDIVPLARVLLERHANQFRRRVPSLTAQAEQSLLRHHWDGNIRELDNVVQRALILATGDTVDVEHLYLPQQESGLEPAEPVVQATVGAMDIRSLEKQHILNTLASVGGVRKLAAEKLGMSERTLRHKLSQYREADHGLPGEN